jgi:3-deoxy-manno-octulosonate cytidylyltransferase (CMP-KDO synthetase)
MIYFDNIIIFYKIGKNVFYAIDDERIENVCRDFEMKYVITSNNHPEHISRIHEVSEKIQADYYICVNGDEPLISEACIEPTLPKIIHNNV